MTWAFLLVPTLFIAHKIIDWVYPGKLRKAFMKSSWNTLESYSRAEIYVTYMYNKYMPLFFVNSPQAAVKFIHNGEEKANYSATEFLIINAKKQIDFDYDFILCEIPIKNVGTYDSYDKYSLRYDSHHKLTFTKLFNDESFKNNSNNKIELNTIIFAFKNSTDTYSIDFKRNQFMVNGNVLFDRPFLKWYLNTYHSTPLNDDDRYAVTFIDHNMNYISVPDYCYILVNKEGYDVVNIMSDCDNEININEINMKETCINYVDSSTSASTDTEPDASTDTSASRSADSDASTDAEPDASTTL